MTFTPWKSRAAAWGSALLLAGAFPPLNGWPLALVALVPVLLAVWSTPVKGRRFWHGFRLGWQFGFVFFTATLWWIQHVTLPGMLALTAYLALYPAVALGCMAWVGLAKSGSRLKGPGKLLLMAGVWTGLEWVRATVLSGFPWNSLGVPLFDLHSARAVSSLVGITGVGGVVIFSTLILAAMIHAKGKKSAAVWFRWAGIWVIAELAFRAGGANSAGTELSFYHAALIQPDVTMEEKMSPDPEVQRQRYFDLEEQTRKAIRNNEKSAYDLVVWPESAVPGFFHDMVQGGAFVDQLSQGNFTLVTGADHEDYGKLYNSVVAMRGTPDNYVLHPKVRLVPFGEFIPFRREVPLFEKILGGLIPMDFSRGTSLEPVKLEAQPFSIVPLVCFEDTIGDHARRFIRPEPQVIVNVTNDNWFHQSPATEMHFANARWRAPELNRTLLRSANTGVSAIVSPQGGVQRIPSFQQNTLTGYFHVGDGSVTFYARHGDLFSQVAGGLALLGVAAVWAGRRRVAADRP